MIVVAKIVAMEMMEMGVVTATGIVTSILVYENTSNIRMITVLVLVPAIPIHISDPTPIQRRTILKLRILAI